MSHFDDVFDFISRNKANRDNGGFNSIPFGLPRLDRHLGGIVRGTQYICTASSGVGKTMLTKFLFVNQPYKFIKDHPELNMKLKILWFAMEESGHEFILSLISTRLKQLYNIDVSPRELSSMAEENLDDETHRLVGECREYFKELEECLEVIDNVSNPYGVFKHVRAYAAKHGKFYFKGEVVDIEQPSTKFDKYVPDDPDEYVIVVGDHIGLLQPENHPSTSTLHGAMGYFSSEYCRKNITKHYNYVAVLVQQQASDKEKVQFTYKGVSIESKLEPSLDGLGDCKVTQRDAIVVLGLFAPARYGIKEHQKYDITKLKDRYRCLMILKNRFGRPDLRLPLYFEGETNTFEELPKIGTDELDQLYQKVS